MTLLALIVVAALIAFAAVGCGDEGDGDGGDGGGEATGPTMGGTLRVATVTGSGTTDPVLQPGNIADIQVLNQLAEPLIELTDKYELQPVLAKEWSSEDGTTWTFTLQEGVTFHNGSDFNADAVVWNFERLRAEDSPMATVYANIDDVVAVDDMTVDFKLTTADSEFPGLLTSYRALMVAPDSDPEKECIGTGPFTLTSWSPEDRAVVEKNADYWMTDDDGNQLPYLDSIEFIASPDVAAQLQGLLGGSLDFVGTLTDEQRQQVEGNDGTKIMTVDTNYLFNLQIRTDQGPAQELAFRQALMAATNNDDLVAIVGPNSLLAGNGTMIGPAYQDYYLDERPPVDIDAAKQLLADAGYADGAKITLYCQQLDPFPALATAWQEQMKQIGVEVDVQTLPTDVFYSEEAGEKSWYEADYCIVDWGTRAVPVEYFNLALVSDGPWNYSRWSNTEFDQLTEAIPQELDEAKRAEMYKDAQKILQDEVPQINLAVNKTACGMVDALDGIWIAPDWPQTLFRGAYLAQ